MQISIRVRLSQEQLEELEDLAGCGYGPEKLAMYFDVPKKDFMHDWQNPDSLIRYHYERGILVTDAEISLKHAKNAKSGNITADQQLEKKRWKQYVEDCKQQIYFNNEVDGL